MKFKLPKLKSKATVPIIIGVGVIALAGAVGAYMFLRNPYGKYIKALGLKQGEEVGRPAREQIISKIVKYAIQDYATYGNSNCVNCLRYGKWSGGNGTSPSYHPDYNFWWGLYTSGYNKYEVDGKKIEARYGCNPYLKFEYGDYTNPNATMSATDMAQFGDYTCMGMLLKEAESFKNRCQPCKGTTLR